MRGKYIVIEGPEGVGKTTMVQMVADKLMSAGMAVKVMREPESQNDLTARAIRHLTQDPRYPMSTRTEVLLYNAARSQSLEIIREAVENGVYCLVDRSYLTTLAIQYYGRGDVQDYEKINDIIDFAVGDMQPDLMIVMDAPVELLRERVKHRYSGDRFDNLDEAFLDRVRAGYLWEARHRNLPIVHALGTVDEVFAQIWTVVADTLSKRDTTKKQEVPQSVGEVIAAHTSVRSLTAEIEKLSQDLRALDTQEPNTQDIASAHEAGAQDDLADRTTWVGKGEQGAFITKQGHERLKSLVTDTQKNTYAFTQQIAPLTVAAAMARLSRRGDDMRITLLDEFIDREDKDGQLLQRVITAYGDDSVQQLMGQHIVVENASNLLTKKLEWGRLAAYLEQSTRYIYFDQKDAEGKYKYYVPETIKSELRRQYVQTMDAIFEIYSELVTSLTLYIRSNAKTPKNEQDGAWKAATKAQACDAIRSLLPVATKSTVGIFASGQALESLISHLQSDELHEARKVGDEILEAARKVVPVILERADKPERGGATVAYRASTYANTKQLADKILPKEHNHTAEPVTLVSYFPRNELDVVADMLYEFSDRPLKELQTLASSWSYDTKLEIFKTYVGERMNRRHRPGRALENIHYTWDLVCDYGIFRDLQRHRIVDDLRWQYLTPRYGFDIPSLVEEAGYTEKFEECFMLSLQLYSQLQTAGYHLEAQYATLLGHKMRWRVTMNAREAMHFNELRTAPQGHPGYRKLVGMMHEALAEVHPHVAESMKFVNQDEDPALTRLAAERYTQFKLSKLDNGSK